LWSIIRNVIIIHSPGEDELKDKNIIIINDLHAEFVDPRNPENRIPILKGVNLEVEKGKIHAIMGPNGSGKSTLSAVIMGHPHYHIQSGEILFWDKDRGQHTPIQEMEVHERARLGIFLTFQQPVAVPGLAIIPFLRKAIHARQGADMPIKEFKMAMNKAMEEIRMKPEFAKRYLNDGFSGGEKKRMEILQMKLLKPDFAILDEIDSGLDIDALKDVAGGINDLADGKRSFLVITHYKRLLEYVKPDKIHILFEGRIIEEGGMELAERLENEGYDGLITANGGSQWKA